jgi:hypothetical protein
MFFADYFFFSARINFSFRLSALAFCNEIVAHIAAGIQPISVTCNTKQIMPVSILPRSINDKKGRKIATKVMD